MGRSMNETERQEVSIRMKNYWASRRQAKSDSLLAIKSKDVTKITTTVNTVVHKPYTFATVTVTVDDKVMEGHGFAKWDNHAPEWDESLGKSIAIGRAKKQIKNEHGIVVK